MKKTPFAYRTPGSIAGAQDRLGILCAILAATAAIGCHDEVDDEDFPVGGTENVATTPQPIDAGISATTCTPDRLTKLQSAVDYASNRVTDGQYAFAECLNRSYLWDAKGQNGWQLGPMVAASPITRINCVPLGENTHVKVSGERLTADNSFIDTHGIVPMAAAIVREILRDRGFGGDTNLVDPHDSNRVSEQGEACIRLWRGVPAVDKGFVLWWDGAKVGHEPSYTRADAVTVCNWNRKTNPTKRLDCYFDDARLGYELFRSGSDPASRVGIEPGYARSDSAANCDYNIKIYPRTWHECLFDGARIGFELYRNKVREVQEPSWAKEKAISECDRGTKAYPRDKVECYFDGRGLGYELLWDGKRVGFEPTWTESQAAIDCAKNKNAYPARLVDCRFDGNAIADPDASENAAQPAPDHARAKQKRAVRPPRE